jgi:CubicO group peptidase (beta-lactamase class C family)
VAGLSKPRLERMHRVLSGYVEREDMPGLVALVNCHDDVHVEVLGALKRDAIFRIASLTKLITAVAATPEQRAWSEIFFGTHSSWGLGMAVDIWRNEIHQTPGRFGWMGGLGTTAYNDPAERMISILFTQRGMDSPEPPKVFNDFWTLAYGALE